MNGAHNGNLATSATSGTDSLGHWLWRLKQGGCWGLTRLCGGVACDYEDISGVPDGLLVSVRATVEVSFHLPRLPRRMHFVAEAGSLWLTDSRGDRGDTENLESIIEDQFDADSLRLIVLPELIAAGESCLLDANWAMLDKRYSISAVSYIFDDRGLYVTLSVEMEAE